MNAPLRTPVSPRDHLLGQGQAPVTLVEYGDYECGPCSRAHGVIEQIRERMGMSLRYVFRHFPLANIHPHAVLAAEAAECAAAQGRFWEMHGLLYRHSARLRVEYLLAYAAELELDTDRFFEDLETGRHFDRVRNDYRSGIASGVRGTPTFFVNGKRYRGSWELPTLLPALEGFARGASSTPSRAA